MYARYTKRFLKSHQDVPIQIKRIFTQKLAFLLTNLRHPSLHAKKYDESNNVWQARVTRGWRFYFTIEKNVYRLDDIIPHPK